MSWANDAKNSLFGTDERGNLVIRNVVIMQGRTKNGKWSNFSGDPTQVDPRGGKRTFKIALPEEEALRMQEDGWNIKYMPPRDEQDDPLYFTEIVLNMEKRIEPEIYVCTEWDGRKKKSRLHGDDVGQLDGMRFLKADVNIFPRVHEHGIKGHCNQLVVVQAKGNLFDGDYDDYEEDDGTTPF